MRLPLCITPPPLPTLLNPPSIHLDDKGVPIGHCKHQHYEPLAKNSHLREAKTLFCWLAREPKGCCGPIVSSPGHLKRREVELGSHSELHCLSFITGGSCHKYHFCRDKHVFCVDKRRVLSRQTRACRDKNDTCCNSRQGYSFASGFNGCLSDTVCVTPHSCRNSD